MLTNCCTKLHNSLKSNRTSQPPRLRFTRDRKEKDSDHLREATKMIRGTPQTLWGFLFALFFLAQLFLFSFFLWIKPIPFPKIFS